MKIRLSSLISALILFSLTMPGCGPTLYEQSRIDFENQIKAIKTIGILDPDMLIFELSAGGVRELMDEWISAATTNFSKVIKKELQTRGLNVKSVTLKGGSADDEEIPYLFQAITESLRWNKTYRNLAVCDDERICKDFSLGDVQHIFSRYKIDALLMVFGVNEMETEARAKARKRSRHLTRLIGMSTRIYISPLGGPGTYVSMALVDKNGSVLWYTGASSGRRYDLRDEAKVKEVTNRMLGRMWLTEQQ